MTYSIQDEFERVQPHMWDGRGKTLPVPRRKSWIIFETQRTCECDRYDGEPHSHRRLALPWRTTRDYEFFPDFSE